MVSIQPPPTLLVNLQGYDYALSLALKHRATCAFAKSFLNLINNFAAFIQIGKVSEYVSEMAGNQRKYPVSLGTKSCLFRAIYLRGKEDH
jgi:hypothetical protein